MKLIRFFYDFSPEPVAAAAEVKAPAPASGDAPADPEDALIESKLVNPPAMQFAFFERFLAHLLLLQLGSSRRVSHGDTDTV